MPGPKNKYNVYDVLLSIKHGRRRGGNTQSQGEKIGVKTPGENRIHQHFSVKWSATQTKTNVQPIRFKSGPP